MIDPALAILYFGLPPMVGVIGPVAVKLHEHSAPPLDDYAGDLGIEVTRDGDIITIRTDTRAFAMGGVMTAERIVRSVVLADADVSHVSAKRGADLPN
jgi:hypothetical protein